MGETVNPQHRSHSCRRQTSVALVSIKPAGSGGSAVPNAVAAACGNKYLVAGLQHSARALDFELELALFYHHALVSRVYKIDPLLSGRVHPKFTTESIARPVFHNTLAFERPAPLPTEDLRLRHGQISPRRSIITDCQRDR